MKVTDVLQNYPSVETGKKIGFMYNCQGKPSYF